MRTEMGNTNTSGIIQEEEGAAALSPNDPPSGNDHNVEKLTSISRDEQDGADKEQTCQFSEVELEAEDSTIKSIDDIQTADSIKEVEPKYEESNHSIESSPHTEEVANIDSNLDFKSDPFTHINGPVQPLDSGFNPPSRNGENSAQVDDSCNDDDTNDCMKTETEHTDAIVASGVDVENGDTENSELMVKETASQQDRSIEEEEDIVVSSVENGLGNEGYEEDVTKMNIIILPQEISNEPENGNNIFPANQTESIEQEVKPKEDFTKVNITLDCSDAASEPKEECMVLHEEIKMASNEPENGNNSFPVNQTESIEHEANEFTIGNSAQHQEKEEGYSTKENPISCLETESIQDFPANEEKTFKKDKELKFEAAGNETIKQIFVTNEAQEIPRQAKEQPQTINTTPGTITEHEMPLDLSNEQCGNGIISPLPIIRSKMLETARRHSVDYNSEPPADTRRFPSFDFGIPFDARSSESDQTPLLRPDKPPPTRRLSIDFQNTVLPATYTRDSLDYNTMGVEEKTIDSPFLITVKKEENGNLTEKTAEILLADMKNIPPANDQLVLASPKGGNGKRKPLPSFFSTCICCTATSN